MYSEKYRTGSRATRTGLLALVWAVLAGVGAAVTAADAGVTPPPVTPAVNTQPNSDPGVDPDTTVVDPRVRSDPQSQTPARPVQPLPGPQADPPAGGEFNTDVVDVATGSYLLQPGDLLKIYVQGMAELTLESRISPSGQLYYPFVRQLKVSGKTLEEVAGMIETGLREHNLKQPDVAIIVQEYAKRFAYIYGEVEMPRDIEIPTTRTVTLDQAIAMAGGLTKSAAEHRVQITQRNANGQLVTRVVDIQRDSPNPEATGIVLRPNDTVFIPSLGGIFILGKVNKPGYAGADLARNYAGELVSASQSIALANGFTEDADPENAQVLRIDPLTGQSQILKINLVEVIDRGKLDLDIPLRSGDTVVIPSKAGVFVMGEVNKPGKYFGDAINPLTVTRAIALAGGFKQYAQPSRIKLYRRGKIPLTINVTAILTNEELDRDVELLPGDILFIPESGL